MRLKAAFRNFFRPRLIEKPQTKTNLLRVLLLTALIGFLADARFTAAQANVGIQPFGAYSGTFDQINVGTFGVHLDIPLYVRKGRGQGTDAGFHLLYDSGSWSWSGPGLGVSAINGKSTKHACPTSFYAPDSGSYWVWGWTIADQTGYLHIFPGSSTLNACQQITNQNTYPTSSLNEYASDGSGYYLSATGGSASVTTPSGQIVTFLDTPGGNQSSGVDANGNQGYNSGFYIDCTTNTAICPTSFGAQNGGDTVNTFLNLSGGIQSPASGPPTSVSPTVLQYKDPQGNTQSITVSYVVYNVTGSLSSQQARTEPLVDTITFPDSTFYKFGYYPSAIVSGAVTGYLQSMTLPTGGTISYAYANANNSGCGIWPSPYADYTGFTRITPDGTTSYSLAALANTTPNSEGECYTTSWQTTVTNADQSYELINFVGTTEAPGVVSGPVAYETSHAWYQAGSTTALKSTMRCYNGQTGDCTSTSVTLPITTLGVSTTFSAGDTSQNLTYFNANGLPTEVDEYGFGSSTPTRKTITAYASLGNVQDMPSSVTIQDGSGNLVAQTTYGYDEYSLTPSPAGLPGHNSVTSSRGNLTSVHRWLNTSNSTIDTHYNYDDAGEVLASEDANGNWTSFGYDSATDTCAVSTTPPTPSSGVSQATSAICDPNSGLVTSRTDANGATTTYSYDLMFRPTGSTTTKSGVVAASTSRSYSGSSLPEVITDTVTATPSPTETSNRTLDGLGRVATSVLPNGATVATSYNAMGQVYSVTNPYLSISDATYGKTFYTYDALGRKTIAANPDSTTKQLCYDGLATTGQTNCHMQRVFRPAVS
jgi:YD repeat-containing protein